VARWAVDDDGRGPDGVIGRRLLVLALVAIIAVGAEWAAVRLALRPRAYLQRVHAGPLTGGAVDATAGAGFEVAAFLLVAWLLASALAVNPVAQWRAQVRGSAVLRAVDAVAPSGLREWSVQLNRLIQRHSMPYFVNPFDTAPVPSPALAPPASADTGAGLGNAAGSVMRIVGLAPSCGRESEGSGFLFARQRVMTNAHVVAGTRTTWVDVPGHGRLPARVVVFDPRRDVAVLYVPGLQQPPLPFTFRTETGASAAVAGYPGGGPFTVVPARIAGQQQVLGPDIYQSREVTREVYTVRARVLPGDSGGPLLIDHGRVAGVVFAAGVDQPDVGYALTAAEVAADATAGSTATVPVSTRGCD
jgi:S1-C subfamily serine protease